MSMGSFPMNDWESLYTVRVAIREKPASQIASANDPIHNFSALSSVVTAFTRL